MVVLTVALETLTKLPPVVDEPCYSYDGDQKADSTYITMISRTNLVTLSSKSQYIIIASSYYLVRSCLEMRL